MIGMCIGADQAHIMLDIIMVKLQRRHLLLVLHPELVPERMKLSALRSVLVKPVTIARLVVHRSLIHEIL